MTLPTDFWQSLQKRSDAELYAAIARPADYVPEALTAVRAELLRRGLPEQPTSPAAGATWTKWLSNGMVTARRF